MPPEPDARTRPPDAAAPGRASPACPRCELERWTTRGRRQRTAAVALLAVAALGGVAAWVGGRRSAPDSETLLAAIAVLRAADPRAPILAAIVTANTRCAPAPGHLSASSNVGLKDLWLAELRCPPSAEGAISATSVWGWAYWHSHHGPWDPVVLRAAVVAVALDRQQCPAWSTTPRALDLYDTPRIADEACVRYSDQMADFLRDKVVLAQSSARRPARIATRVAVGLALAALVAAFDAWRSGGRARRLLAPPESDPYRSAPSARCERHAV